MSGLRHQVNFRQPHPLSSQDLFTYLTPEYLYLIISVIVSSVIGWSIPSIIRRVKARTQRKHLKECITQIGKLDKNAIEDKIIGYYVDGKISEDHRQLLNDKISEYYEDKDSERYGAPFT